MWSALPHLLVYALQAMLWAIGVGAKRRLPAAAALNWVLKDGLGRLGKLLFAASLGRTFDSNLKVKPSNSCLPLNFLHKICKPYEVLRQCTMEGLFV